MQTGATEIYQKLPIHLATLFRCTPHQLIFSDLAQNVSDYRIHDALEPIGSNVKDSHEDFTLYWNLQKYHREGQDISQLKGQESWKLDKWKFLPMLHKTFQLSPSSIDWFVFIEADTMLSWLNLLQWLATMDPTTNVYTGSENYYRPLDVHFAHGGR